MFQPGYIFSISTCSIIVCLTILQKASSEFFIWRVCFSGNRPFLHVPALPMFRLHSLLWFLVSYQPNLCDPVVLKIVEIVAKTATWHFSIWYSSPWVVLKKNGPIPASFTFILVLFSFQYQFQWYKWCAWVVNTGPQDCRRRRNHGARPHFSVAWKSQN